MRVLVVDDDATLRSTLRIALQAGGHEVVLVGDGRSALQALREDGPDLVLLDLGLPDVGGVEVLRRLRTWSSIPVVVLSARDGPDDKVQALDLGADDSVTKPFGPAELLARVRAAGRRAGADLPVVEAGRLSIDLRARVLRRGGEPVRLTPTEWAVLEVLVRAQGGLVRRADLLHEVWGPAYSQETNYLRVYLGTLRKKLEEDTAHPVHLLTEPGIGYRFV
jgi:two-component system KDP operon response regulator KdpE